MHHLRFAPVLVMTILVCSLPVRAGIRPSFNLEYCAAAATDIVVVEENGAAGPSLTVLETWKGALKKGDKLVVPGLPAAGTLAGFPTGWGSPPKLPAFTGHRIVLFLKPNPFLTSTPNPANARVAVMTDDRAEAAGRRPEYDEGIAQACALWIECDRPYGFVQMMNPGPSVLTPIGESEAKLKEAAFAIFGAQEELRKIGTLSDRTERVLKLAAMVQNSNCLVRRDAIGAMGACGTPALPALRGLLKERTQDQESLVSALTMAAGPHACDELTKVVTTELDYWKKTGPALAIGWWNVLPAADVPREGYMLLYSVLGQLAGIDCPAAREPVMQLRGLWVMLPQLNDASGLNQMVARCDSVLTRNPARPASDSKK